MEINTNKEIRYNKSGIIIVVDQYEVDMKVKFAYGIVPGSVGGGQDRRDNIRTAYENGVGVIFLAGSAAGIAAEVTAERFDELYASDDGFIRETLSGKKADGALLFAAVKENRYLAGHMGGGLIARLDGSCSILSKPEAGGPDELRVYKGEIQEPFGFMLMSDAACRSLYEGADKLSPACGTFLEWLQEYDEETVSEALTDNMNKYFVKNVKGDISVGMMVSDKTEETETVPEEIAASAEPEAIVESAEAEGIPETAELAEELPEEIPESGSESSFVSETSSGNGKDGSILKYLVAALVILVVIFVFTMKPGANEPKDAAKTESRPPVTSSENTSPPAVETPAGLSADPAAGQDENESAVTFSVEDPVSYEAGVYQVGGDIPAGEYFFWTGDMLKPDSVKVNDVTCLSGDLYCMTVKVGDGDTLTTDVRFTAAENVEPVKAVNGTLISGKYRIGKDIAPGTYKISPLDQNAEGKYYSILDGEISNDETFSGENTVVVPREGYIVFYNAALTVGQQ